MPISQAFKQGAIVGVIYFVLAFSLAYTAISFLNINAGGVAGNLSLSLFLGVIGFILGFIFGFVLWEATHFLVRLTNNRYPALINGLLFFFVALAGSMGDIAGAAVSFFVGYFSYKASEVKLGD